MYLEHFGLGVNPFSLSPKLDFLYKSGTFEESMAHLVYGLDNHEAIVLITGPIGTGKTMALQTFLTSLGPRFEFALITNTRVTSIELLKLILEDLDVKWPMGADKSDLLIVFKEFLQAASREGKMVLIVVDEAQNLAPEVLEEIRLLTNLGQGETQPVQIILVGQPELEETVNRPDLAQIRQRIRVHYTLDPLSREETEEYINHRMKVAGCPRRVFTRGALDRIFRSSHGVPRLVNTVAGEALLTAFVAGHEMVQPVDVEEDQDLRYSTGPAPAEVPAPQPQPTQVPPARVPEPPVAAPPVAPSPAAPTFSPPVPGYAPPPPVRDQRRAEGGMGKALRPWVVAALVILVLAALYNFGFLDGMTEGILSRSDRPTEQVNTEDAMVENETALPEPVPGNPATTALVEPEVEKQDQAVAEEDTQEEKTPVEADPIQKNVAQVVEKPADPGPAVSSAPVTGDRYYIHISSFRTPERADSYIRRWDHPGHEISVRNQTVRGVEWSRIYLGPYAARDDALLAALRFQQEGIITYYRVLQLPGNPGS